VLGFLLQLGAKFARRDELCWKFSFARARQDSRRLDIAQDDGDFRRDLSGGNGIGDRDKVRTFARTEDAETEWFAHAP